MSRTSLKGGFRKITGGALWLYAYNIRYLAIPRWPEELARILDGGSVIPREVLKKQVRPQEYIADTCSCDGVLFFWAC